MIFNMLFEGFLEGLLASECFSAPLRWHQLSAVGPAETGARVEWCQRWGGVSAEIKQHPTTTPLYLIWGKIMRTFLQKEPW